jgi:hypothetical protein
MLWLECRLCPQCIPSVNVFPYPALGSVSQWRSRLAVSAHSLPFIPGNSPVPGLYCPVFVCENNWVVVWTVVVSVFLESWLASIKITALLHSCLEYMITLTDVTCGHVYSCLLTFSLCLQLRSTLPVSLLRSLQASRDHRPGNSSSAGEIPAPLFGPIQVRMITSQLHHGYIVFLPVCIYV